MEKKISQLSLNQLQSIVGGIAYATATATATMYPSTSTSWSSKLPVMQPPVVR